MSSKIEYKYIGSSDWHSLDKWAIPKMARSLEAIARWIESDDIRNGEYLGRVIVRSTSGEIRRVQ